MRQLNVLISRGILNAHEEYIARLATEPYVQSPPAATETPDAETVSTSQSLTTDTTTTTLTVLTGVPPKNEEVDEVEEGDPLL